MECLLALTAVDHECHCITHSVQVGRSVAVIPISLDFSFQENDLLKSHTKSGKK